MRWDRRIALFGILLGTGAPVCAAQTVESLQDSAHKVSQPAEERNTWGVDIMASDGGFGLGTFYKREISPDLSWFATFSISEAKDEREVEQYDYYTGLSFVPGKLNRFLVLPLYGGIQYRLFREDIVETFRPFVNAAFGPTIVYSMPFAKITTLEGGYPSVEQVDFFKAIGMGQAHYTIGGYIGFGAHIGAIKGNVFGVNFRYYFVTLLSGSLPSTYNLYDGSIEGTKKDFGGVYITISFGSTF
jgi:hypothetical protein